MPSKTKPKRSRALTTSVTPEPTAKGRAAKARKAAAATETSNVRSPSRSRSEARLPIVALGASAGGLGALDEFFVCMPAESDMAFVVITHQPASGKSVLRDLLARRTDMTVVEVTREVVVEANHVYTPAPGRVLDIVDGVLRPARIGSEPPIPMPVDRFFRSLARDQKECAIGIILSGTGSDGSLGLKEIKAELGMVLAQDEQSAKHRGMPHSAAATDLVDFVLPVAEMPKRLLAYAETLQPGMRAGMPPTRDSSSVALHQVFVLIRERTGHDFAQYKVSTMRRRIERRMNVHHVETEKKYVRFLQANPGEVDLLFKELLIGVTSFFRDPDAWQAVTSQLEKHLASQPEDYVFRAWLAGCSTGEEAYSLAIVLRELKDTLKRPLHVQIFATDLDATAIDFARAGTYPAGIANDVSRERLARFFVDVDGSYRVRQEIREMVVFAPQNLIGDPPFTKLDFLSCRNLLIYLEPELQKKLIPIFHYALKPNGLLLLGSSESISAFGDLFLPLEKKCKLFRRRASSGPHAEFPSMRIDATRQPVLRTTTGSAAADFGVGVIAERIMLRELVPPTVFVHERGDVVHIHGRTGRFLEPAPGPQAAANIFNMAREGLQISLSAAMRQATAEDREIIHRGVELKSHGETTAIDLRVRRLHDPEPLRGVLRVSFVNANHVAADVVDVPKPDRVHELERALQYTRETQQSTLEQLETTNEELKSTNEEMQSTNEELQSTNEELETSKEEMQSLNEELQTLNAELQDKVEELSRANNDMKNLLNGTNIATIFLDNDLNIKRYTDPAKNVIRLIPSDVGRPIGDLVSTLEYDRLVDDAREVLQTLVYKEIEVKGDRDAWYLMRVLPYRTVENVIDGLVLTFVDITVVRALRDGQRRLLDALKSSPTRVFGHDKSLRYTWASGDLFGRTVAEIEGKTDADLFGTRVARELIEVKKAVKKTLLPTQRRVTVTLARARHHYQLYVEPVRDAKGIFSGLLCVSTEVPATDG